GLDRPSVREDELDVPGRDGSREPERPENRDDVADRLVKRRGGPFLGREGNAGAVDPKSGLSRTEEAVRDREFLDFGGSDRGAGPGPERDAPGVQAEQQAPPELAEIEVGLKMLRRELSRLGPDDPARDGPSEEIEKSQSGHHAPGGPEEDADALANFHLGSGARGSG